MRIGIFGGSFDPVHYGHLLLAESCREQCRLDQVWFLPAALPPHKQTALLAPPDRRLDMLELATGGHPAFFVRADEIDRGGVSYTVDTLAALRASAPGHEWFLLLGADSLADLPNWREPQRIAELAQVVVVRRPERSLHEHSGLAASAVAAPAQAAAPLVVAMPPIGLSASDIRDRVASGRSIRFMTPRAVELYIQTHGLYRAAADRNC